MVTVPKAELDALIRAVSAASADLHRIVEAVRAGRPDAEVEITAAILNLNALGDQLRALRRRETPSPTTPIQPLED